MSKFDVGSSINDYRNGPAPELEAAGRLIVERGFRSEASPFWNQATWTEHNATELLRRTFYEYGVGTGDFLVRLQQQLVGADPGVVVLAAELNRLMFLLGYAANPGFREEEVEAGEEPDFFSAIAHSFVRQCEQALLKGPISSYVTVDESLRMLCGRIRVGDQLSRHLGLPIPLEVTYDEFTMDIAENRILRSALRLLLRLSEISAEIRSRLSHLDRKLDGVGVVPRGVALPAWQETRANAHYVPALRLAAIVLNSLSVEANIGSHRMSSFAVEVSKVFEDFVAVALHEAFAQFPGTIHAQYESNFDEIGPGEKSRTKLYLDVVYCENAVPTVVFDAKYKASSSGSYSNDDEYQMLAYCTALEVSRAWLIYAGAGQERLVKVRNTNKEIVHFPLDLSLSPQRLLERVDQLAGKAYKVQAAESR